MLQFNGIQNSSDLASYNAEEQVKTTTNISKKDDLASSIVHKFLESILADTLTNDEPVSFYEYEVDDSVDLKQLQYTVDTIIYSIFNKNLFALPDVFYSPASDAKPISRLVIHSPNTIKSIMRSDERLEREVSEFLNSNLSVLKSGHPITFTGFEHVVSTLPYAYAESRSSSIVNNLDCKGYTTYCDNTTMYLTISVK